MKHVKEFLNKCKVLTQKPKYTYNESEKKLAYFLTQLKNFYKIYDVHEKSKFSQVFELLFVNPSNVSGEYIAQKLFISTRTFYRYKKKIFAFIKKVIEANVLGSDYGHMLQ